MQALKSDVKLLGVQFDEMRKAVQCKRDRLSQDHAAKLGQSDVNSRRKEIDRQWKALQEEVDLIARKKQRLEQQLDAISARENFFRICLDNLFELSGLTNRSSGNTEYTQWNSRVAEVITLLDQARDAVDAQDSQPTFSEP